MESRPDDFRLQYNWQQGSLPPPYYYEYTIQIDPSGNGQIEMIPDYPAAEVPTWTEAFTVTPTDLDQLYQVMVEQGAFSRDWRAQDSPPVGGSSEWLTATAHGRTIEIPPYVVESQASAASAIYAAVQALVPQSIWDRLVAQREEYVQEHSAP